MKQLRSLFSIPIHPMLFAVYFVLALLAFNISQVRASAAIRSLTGSLLAAAVFFLLLRLAVKDWRRAGLIVTLSLVLFFTYGHVYQYLEVHPVFGFTLGRHRLLLPIWIGLAIIGTWLAASRVKDPAYPTKMLNWVGLVLLAFPVYQLVSFAIQSRVAESQVLTGDVLSLSGSEIRGSTMPDIYWIVLDAYSRNDVLLEQIGFDNSAFLDGLTDLGFYVAYCSQSNYAQTQISIASTLNMDYIDALGIDQSQGTLALIPYIRHSALRSTLENLGYTIVGFQTGYYWLRIEDADVYFSPESRAANASESLLDVNGFELLLIRSSAAMLLTDTLSRLPGALQPNMDYPNQEHREEVLYTLEKLEGVPLAVQSPKFVYAHIVAPHFPVVFGANGEYVQFPAPADMDDATFNVAYRDEALYINRRILEVVREIIQISATPPVIIIQADHGNDRALPEDRQAILNAYYLPGGGDQFLYPTITPVNTFRTVLNYYFGAEYEILEDRSFYSPYEEPFNFTPMENKCVLTGP